MKKLIINSVLFLTLFGCAGTCFASYGYQPRKEYRDSHGRLEGYSQADLFMDQTNHYDCHGRRQGYTKKNLFSDEVGHYDNMGRLQGTTKYSQW